MQSSDSDLFSAPQDAYDSVTPQGFEDDKRVWCAIVKKSLELYHAKHSVLVNFIQPRRQEHYVRRSLKIIRGQIVTKNVVGPQIYCRDDPPGDFWCGIAHARMMMYLASAMRTRCGTDTTAEYHTKNFSFVLEKLGDSPYED